MKLSFSKKMMAWSFAALNIGSIQAAELPTLVEFARPLGMGGAFTAVADDQNIFNYNPAGMVQRTGGQFTMLEIAGGISKDSKTAYDYLNDNKDKLNSGFDKLPPSEQASLINDIRNNISKLDPRVYLAADVASYVSGPMPFHMGFGLFGAEDLKFKLDASATIPNISLFSNADVLLPISLAYRWKVGEGKLGVGATGKFIRRFQVKQDNISVLTLDTLDAPPIAKGKGFGTDLGFLYQPTTRTNVGLMLQDFGGTKIKYDAEPAKNGFPSIEQHSGVVRTRTNLGVAVVPEKLFWILPSGDRWTFAFDIKDVMNNDEHVVFENGLRKVIGQNFGTHAYLGAEYRWWFLRFRGGAHQGYPSFGLGVDIPFLKLDYAYYGREIGYAAGDRRQDNHIISLAMRFGSGATESRERIKNKNSAKGKKDMAVPQDDTPTAATPSSSGETKKSGDAPHSEPQKTGDTQKDQIP